MCEGEAQHAVLEGETMELTNVLGQEGRLIVVHIGNENEFLKEASDKTYCYFKEKNGRRLGWVDYDEKK